MPSATPHGDDAAVTPRDAEVAPEPIAEGSTDVRASGATGVGEAGGSTGARVVGDNRTLGSSIGWTVLGTLLPGLGLWPTRRRGLGLGIFAVVAAALAGLVWLAMTRLGLVASVAVRPGWLLGAALAAAALAILFAVLIVGTHLLTRPRPTTPLQRGVGAVVVGLLCFLVAAPLAVGADYALAQADLVNSLFKHSASSRSQTRPTLTSGQDPFQDKPRLNVLLLGGDSSAARDKLDPSAGIRTDTVMLASIDTTNGNTAIIQLPRNLEAFGFPAGSPLAKAYPNGYWDGKDRQNAEYELNTVWKNVPLAHPELFKDTDYPNADALKSAVQGITGLTPDYFLLLDIDGIQKLIDAMGGLTINVNYRVPMAQTAEEAAQGIPPKSGYLEKGPNRHLTGYEAMWYARSRSQSTDPDRMARQSCVVKAIVDQANPQTLLTHYESIAAASKNAILTDIPQELAPAMMDLAVRMKDARLKRVLFGYPTTKFADGTSFKPWNPDVAKMQQLIQAGIAASENTPASTSPSATAAATASTRATPSAHPSATPSRSSTSASATPSSDQTVDANADLKDACAWHG